MTSRFRIAACLVICALAPAVFRPAFSQPQDTFRLTVHTVDGGTGLPVCARVGVFDRDGVPVAPPDPGGHLYQEISAGSYFYCAGSAGIDVPAGKVRVYAGRGFEYEAAGCSLVVVSDTVLTVALERFVDMNSAGWYSADTHVHITHEPAIYDVTPEMLFTAMEAEDLNFVNSMEGPDWFSGALHPASTPDRLIFFSKEHRNPSFAHLALVGLRQWIEDVWCTTAEVPCGRTLDKSIYERVHAGGNVLVVAAHPASTWDVFDNSPWPGRGMWRGAAFDLVGGCVDAIELMSYSNAGTPLDVEVYRQALNAGFRIPPTAGTDAVLCRGTSPPPGGYRVYARPPAGEPFGLDSWMEGLRRGDCFVSNYPLFLGFELDGRGPGETVRHRSAHLKGSVSVLCALPLERVDIVGDPGVLASIEPSTGGLEVGGTFRINTSGVKWVAARAVGAAGAWHVTDAGGLFAETGPVYLELSRHDPGRPDAPSGVVPGGWPERDAADFFIDLLEDVDQLFRFGGEMPDTSRITFDAALDEARYDFGSRVPDPPGRFELVHPVEISWFHPRPWVRTRTPEFRWRRSVDPDPSDVVTYDLWLDAHPGFPDPVTVAGLTDTVVTLPDSLALDDKSVYYWRVIPVDRGGNRTLGSPTTWSFVVDVNPVATGGFAPAVWDIVGAWPNPFNPRVHISWSVPDGTVAHQLGIFDARGGRVTTLHDGTKRAGVWTADWDGTDDRGVRVASGVYFARLVTATGGSIARKLILVR